MLASCCKSAVLTRNQLPGRALIQCRHKYKKKWAETRRSNAPVDLAIDAFDGMYGNGLYERQWPSIRLALLSLPKYCAVINNFSGRRDEVQARLVELGAMPLETLVRKVQPPHATVAAHSGDSDAAADSAKSVSTAASDDRPSDVNDRLRSLAGIANQENAGEEAAAEEDAEFMPATKFVEETIEPPPMRIDLSSIERSQHPVVQDEFPPSIPYFLKVLVFPRGDVTRFPAPKKDLSGFHEYYLMDAASLLPVIALGLRPGDIVYDMCAAPGGKSLTMLQTLLPGHLTCNDVSESRTKRLSKVLQDFFPLDTAEMPCRVQITNHDGAWYYSEADDKPDRILVDAPCTNDRVSCTENENNMFTSRRTADRNAAPQRQLELLMCACDGVKVGGTVVYSTCSLSPVQNDGVVHLAITELERLHKIKMAVVDTSPFREIFNRVFRFLNTGSVYGQTILPFVPNNFGPMYFSKLLRLQ